MKKDIDYLENCSLFVTFAVSETTFNMKKLLIFLNTLILIVLLCGCNSVGTNGHFSSRLSEWDEPQTDDERTFIGEYKDYLGMVDSLAMVWDGNDTITMRRLYCKQLQQSKRLDKFRKRDNIRHSMIEKVEMNLDQIEKEIDRKFTLVQRCEFRAFHECFSKGFFPSINYRSIVDMTIRENTYGEKYIIVKEDAYEKDESGEVVSRTITMRCPIDEEYLNRLKGIKIERKNVNFTEPEIKLEEEQCGEIIKLSDLE